MSRVSVPKCPFRNISLGFSWTASCVSAPALCLPSARLGSFFTAVCMNVVAHRREMTGFHTELVHGVIRRRIWLFELLLLQGKLVSRLHAGACG